MQIHAYQRTALQTVRLDNGTGTLGRVFRLENATANLGTRGRLELRDCLSIPRNTKNVTKTPSTPSCMPWTCIHSLLRWLSNLGLMWFWCIFLCLAIQVHKAASAGVATPPAAKFTTWAEQVSFSRTECSWSQLCCIMPTFASDWETGRKLSGLLHLYSTKTKESNTAHLPPTCRLN